MNQCDGCRQGAPLRNGLHIDENGRAFMGCQKHRYVKKEPCKFCDPSRAKRVGRATWLCADCGSDISLSFVLWAIAEQEGENETI